MNKQYALVTGASSGIGWATAMHLDSLGYRVIAGVRRPEDAQRLQEATKQRAVPLMLDVTRPDQVTEAFDCVRDYCGANGLAALINNAGHNYNSAFEHSDEVMARRMMEVNFFGVVRTTQMLIPLLRQHAQSTQCTAKLINVASIGGVIGLPWESFYHASKFAVLGLTESLRYELHSQGIRATAVLPGGIKTEFARKTNDSVVLALAEMNEGARARYGDGLRRLADMVSLVDRWGSPPELVARRIASIVRARNPALKHFVGVDAHVLNALANLLPRRALHSLLRPVFGA